MAFFVSPTSQGTPVPPSTPSRAYTFDLKPLPETPPGDAERSSAAEQMHASRRSSSLGRWWKNLRPKNRPEKGGTIRDQHFWDEYGTTVTPPCSQTARNRHVRKDATVDSGQILDWNVPTVVPEPQEAPHNPIERRLPPRPVMDTDTPVVDDRRFSFAPQDQVPEQLSLGIKTSADKRVAFQNPIHHHYPSDESKMQAKYSAGRRVSLASHAAEAKKESRRQRRALKESSDFLGVQGFNPRTGTEDSLTSSSLPTSGEIKGVSEDTKANTSKQGDQRDLDNSEKTRYQKTQNPIRPRKGMRWRRYTNEWSSVPNPMARPMIESVHGSLNKSRRASLATRWMEETILRPPSLSQVHTSTTGLPPLLDPNPPSPTTELRTFPWLAMPQPSPDVGSPSTIIAQERSKQPSFPTPHAEQLHANGIQFNQAGDCMPNTPVKDMSSLASQTDDEPEGLLKETEVAGNRSSDIFLGTGTVDEVDDHRNSTTCLLPTHQPIEKMPLLSRGKQRHSLRHVTALIGRGKRLRRNSSMAGNPNSGVSRQSRVPHTGVSLMTTADSHRHQPPGTIRSTWEQTLSLDHPLSGRRREAQRGKEEASNQDFRIAISGEENLFEDSDPPLAIMTSMQQIPKAQHQRAEGSRILSSEKGLHHYSTKEKPIAGNPVSQIQEVTEIRVPQTSDKMIGLTKRTIHDQRNRALRMPALTPTTTTTSGLERTAVVPAQEDPVQRLKGEEEKKFIVHVQSRPVARCVESQSVCVTSNHTLNLALGSLTEGQTTRADTISMAAKLGQNTNSVRRRSLAHLHEARHVGGLVQAQRHRRSRTFESFTPAVDAARLAVLAHGQGPNIAVRRSSVHKLNRQRTTAKAVTPVPVSTLDLSNPERHVQGQAAVTKGEGFGQSSYGLMDCQVRGTSWTPQLTLPGSYPWELDDAGDDIVGHSLTARNEARQSPWKTSRGIAARAYYFALALGRVWWRLTKPVFESSSDYWTRHRNQETTMLDLFALVLASPVVFGGLMVLVQLMRLAAIGSTYLKDGLLSLWEELLYQLGV